MSTLQFPPSHEEPKFDIAVVIPTRGRKEPLKKCLETLIDKATNVKKILLMFAFDNDDTESIAYFRDTIIPWMNEHNCEFICYEFDRMGYMRLNEYVNYLSVWASAHWVFFWNDDAVMLTDNWDTKISAHNGEFKLLSVHTNNDHPYSVFPIVPKEWINCMGHMSPHTFSDAWVSEIAYMLDIFEHVDIDVLHNRADITGENEDTTYKERNMPPADPRNPSDINNIEWVKKRYLEANKLAWYMKNKGLDISFWVGVREGKNNPWIKLKENDPNDQVFIQPVKGST